MVWMNLAIAVLDTDYNYTHKLEVEEILNETGNYNKRKLVRCIIFDNK